MYYVYVIQSMVYKTRYVGSTQNVIQRLHEHNTGRCRYTLGRMPWSLVYKEEFMTRSDAMKQEKFFKSGQGRKYLDANLIL